MIITYDIVSDKEAKLKEAMNDAADAAGTKRCVDYMEISIRQ